MNVNIYSYPPRLEKALILIPLSSVCFLSHSPSCHLLPHLYTHNTKAFTKIIFMSSDEFYCHRWMESCCSRENGVSGGEQNFDASSVSDKIVVSIARAKLRQNNVRCNVFVSQFCHFDGIIIKQMLSTHEDSVERNCNLSGIY